MEDFGRITWEMEEGAVDANTNRVNIIFSDPQSS